MLIFCVQQNKGLLGMGEQMEVSDVFFFSLYSNKMKTNPHLPIYLKIPPAIATTTKTMGIKRTSVGYNGSAASFKFCPYIEHWIRSFDISIWYCLESGLKLTTA